MCEHTLVPTASRRRWGFVAGRCMGGGNIAAVLEMYALEQKHGTRCRERSRDYVYKPILGRCIGHSDF